MANQIDATLQFHAHALNVRAQRQQLLASNIANADTPGYKARDLDFRQALQEALGGRVAGVPLARTAAAQLRRLWKAEFCGQRAAWPNDLQLTARRGADTLGFGQKRFLKFLYLICGYSENSGVP